MTSGERMIWAAAFVAEFRELDGTHTNGIGWTVDTAARCANRGSGAGSVAAQVSSTN